MGGTGNNLFNSEYTSGDLQKIAPFVRIGQVVSVWIISIIGFGIVISTVIKQAMHGLYATNTKLWDRVDEVHRTKVAEGLGKIKAGGNELTNMLGFLQSFIFAMLPNVKAVTEFDGDTTDVRTFFTKSLPISCLYMFVGVFIFYGYTTKFGEKVSQFGTTLIDNYFLRIDPIAWAEKIPGKVARVSFATDGSQLDFDKHVNQVSKKAYQTLQTLLPDITKEKQPDVAKAVETWVIDCLSQEPQAQCDSEAWEMSFTSTTSRGEPDLSYVHNKASKDGHTITYAYAVPVSMFDTGSVQSAVDTDYLRINLTFTEKAKTNNYTSMECVMNGGRLREENSGARLVIELDVDTSASISTGGSCTGYIGGVPVRIEYRGGEFILTASGSTKLTTASSKTKVTDITNIRYVCGNSTNTIREINISGAQGSSISFSSTSGNAKWNWGQQPSAESGRDNSTSGGSGNSDNEDEGDW